MDNDTIKKLLDEFYPQLEDLDTQCSAIRQFLKDERQITEGQLAPYLEQAGKGSSVKWLANRLRVEQLLSSAMKEAEKPGEQVVETTSGRTTATPTQDVQTTRPASAEEKTAGDKKSKDKREASKDQTKEAA